MEDRERGADHRVAADRANTIDRHEKPEPSKRETFATGMARAAFRHHYWNDELEDEKRRSLEKARARVEAERRAAKETSARRKKRADG